MASDAQPATDNIEITPGTVHLVDADGLLKSKHASGADQDIVLVPTPSSHPDDPLNWSRRRKMLAAGCMALYVLVTGICSSALYSTLDPLSKATGLTYLDLNSGTGYMFLLFGWGCLFWQAVATQYGMRPVYLISAAGTMGVMVWQAHIKSNGEWIAAKILQGIFGAPIESIAEVTIAHVFFTHERGKYMALYALALGYSNGIAPLIMGFINDGMGYQWVFYWCAIFCAILFVVLFFFMEESRFDRAEYMNLPQPLEDRVNRAADPEAQEPGFNTVRSENESMDKKDNAPPGTTTHEMQPTATNVSRATASTSYAKSSYASRLKPIRSKHLHSKNIMLRLIGRPVYLLSFPIIAYAGFLYGANITWLSVVNATQSMVLANAPYKLSTSSVGLTFLAPLVGTTLAQDPRCIYTGIFGDRFIVKMARRNGGFMEAEHRLWLFMPSLLLIPMGCILFGVGAYHEFHWFGIVFAMGTISFTTTAGSQICVAYTVDCYHDLGGEALAAVMVVRNTMAFAIGYGVTPWVTNLGYQNAFILAACAGLAHNLTVFPIMRWGARLRQRSAEKYWLTVKKGWDLGAGH